MSVDRNVVLTGFMGTGKSSAGRLVADRLGRPFVDTDERIIAHFGKPIAQVFAEDGEGAFRAAEARICREAASQPGQVISTGGGALVDVETRAALAASGVLICLTASLETILERVGDEADRPLLRGPLDERRRRVQQLLAARRDVYATIPHQIDTTGLSAERVAQEVLDAFDADCLAPGASRLVVRHPAGSYPIFAGDGLLSRAGSLLLNRGLRPGKLAIVTNAVVADRHLAALDESLREAGFQPTICLMEVGERYKTLATVQSLYDDFLAARLDRHSAILALGGGVVGDAAGFAAATYLRGVPFIQAPTTLLSMVDASVGGKTGVDLPQGKNLVGAFKQPELVLLDTATLSTLPSAEFRSGLAEVVKHGIIGDPGLFAQLETDGPPSLTQMVVDAVRVKVQVVQEDPFEKGRRAVLNLGHTFGHALELESDFTMRHGEAVAIGLVAAASLAVEIGECTPQLAQRIRTVVERMGLPIAAPGFEEERIVAAMGHDKKRAGRTLRFVIPRDLGDVIVIDNPGDETVRCALRSVLDL